MPLLPAPVRRGWVVVPQLRRPRRCPGRRLRFGLGGATRHQGHGQDPVRPVVLPGRGHPRAERRFCLSRGRRGRVLAPHTFVDGPRHSFGTLGQRVVLQSHVRGYARGAHAGERARSCRPLGGPPRRSSGAPHPCGPGLPGARACLPGSQRQRRLHMAKFSRLAPGTKG